ncbi:MULTISPECIES: iron-containing alcohol dehydrogenase [Methylobacteriaceae]|uniref:Alcohol dehydrogenase 2 n=1 Tax=Methylorubrum extorquens (strain DSM 6343 / CIP 106787 / DM4) TaxID=661410 RepID=C7CN20_METED|nr:MULTISPECIES: iron-containing alcohol dehydrogenase [Methylobacteriaceae]AYO84734.1 iron-containing alcohol dehydrogenase [Methylobacterium brachiatum]CAX17050.1 putative iron-containing alcohol dehydrogenase [Methylorubrum extorquens DM4]
MKDFSFHTTRSIVSEAGASARLAGIVGPVLGQRVFLVTDAALRRLGLLDSALASLDAAGIDVAIFDGVQADPPEANIYDAVALARSHRATGVLAIGGGSPMDVAKVVALLARSGETLAEVYGVGAARGPRLPLALVPTTAGTGSEVTPIAIVTTGEAQKKGVVSPLLLPDVAVLDADLTLGLPPAVTAATGIDSMVHAIEAYSSASPNNNPISRGLALQALTLLGGNIREATFNGGNRAARGAMLLGSLLAGQAFANSPVAAVHALAYPIGGHYHVPHGLSNALVLPHVLRFNLDAARRPYADLAPALFPHLARRPEAERAEAFIEALADLARELGVPQRLRDVAIPADALPRLARDAMMQTRLLVNNPRPLTEADALAIYQAAH